MTDDLLDFLEEDSGPVDPIDIDTLHMNNLSASIGLMVAHEEEIAALQAQLDNTKKAHQRLSQETIPEIFMQMGNVQLVKLDSGESVEIIQGLDASIKKPTAPQAMHWLEDNGYEGIVKNEIKILTGKGEHEIAEKTKLRLVEVGIPFEEKESVHPSTLKASVKEMLAAGLEPPEELFSIFQYNKTKLTRS